MKPIVLLVALAMASSVWAQAKPEAAKPEAVKEAAKKEAAKPAAKKEAAKPAAQKVAKKSRRNEDARHCLQRPNNNEVIKCAEEYL